MSELEPPNVGARVQAFREQLGLSMRGLAELCGLSPNTISLIERGTTSPTVSTLHQLATALRVPITALFEAKPGEARVIQTRPSQRPFYGSAAAQMESLGSGLRGQSLQSFLVTLAPGADSGPKTMSHSGHELVYCLAGTLEYEIDGQHYRLAVGESLVFESVLPHCWRNSCSEPTVFLLAFQSDVTREAVEPHLHI